MDKATVELKADVFARAADNAHVFASQDAARPMLGRAYIHVHEGRLRFVTTDSYTLLIEEPLDTPTWTGDPKILVPTKVLKEAARAARTIIPRRRSRYGTARSEVPSVTIKGHNKEGGTSFFDGTVVVPGVATFEFTSANTGVGGTFPDYTQLVPPEPVDTMAGLALNPRYISRVGQIKLPKSAMDKPAQFYFNGDLKPVSVKIDVNIHALFMPVRIS